MNSPTITPVLNWRNKINKSGHYPIHLRITKGAVSRYYLIDVPRKIKMNEWSGKENAWVKNAHPFVFEINNKIRDKVSIGIELIKRYYGFNKQLGVNDILTHLKKKGNSNSFLDYMDQYIIKPPEKLELNTIKKYKTCLTHLKKYQSDSPFSEIDSDWVKGFQTFMETELNLQGAACKKYMEAFRKVIKKATKDNYLDKSHLESLFDDVKIKVKKAKRTFLETADIRLWKSHVFLKNEEYLARDRDLFLFQIYTGYYYKDLAIFTKDQLRKDEEYGYFITGARDKNDNQTMIPLFKFPYAAAIIEKYKSDAGQPTVFDLKYLLAEPAYNRNLKQIAKIIGINVNVSNKVGRHTNAQLWVRHGAERPILSKMLGHTNEETTKNYYDVNIPEIIEGTKRADFEKMGI